MNIRRSAALATALFLTSSMVIAQDAPPTLEEMWAVIQRQQAEIEELRAQLARDPSAITGELLGSFGRRNPGHTDHQNKKLCEQRHRQLLGDSLCQDMLP